MKQATILMVEDNPHIRRTNRGALELEGYHVLEADTLAAAKALAAEAKPDLILLDILLPDGNGRDDCAALFAPCGAQILFVSALKTKQEMIAGLRVGDDYITKPYKMAELLARVEALLQTGKTRVPQTLAFGPLKLDIFACRAFLYGEDMLLSHKEFSMLLLLAQNNGVALGKAVVYEKVWGQPLNSDSQALYTVASRLKNKLAPAECGGIRLTTKRGEGYRFTFVEKE